MFQTLDPAGVVALVTGESAHVRGTGAISCTKLNMDGNRELHHARKPSFWRAERW